MIWIVAAVLAFEVICGLTIIDLLSKIHRSVDWDAKVAYDKKMEEDRGS